MKKKCTKCLVVKDIEDFVSDNRLVHGKASRCKQCDREMFERYRRAAGMKKVKP